MTARDLLRVLDTNQLVFAWWVDRFSTLIVLLSQGARTENWYLIMNIVSCGLVYRKEDHCSWKPLISITFIHYFWNYKYLQIFLCFPEIRTVRNPGVGRFRGRDVGVILLVLLPVANEPAGQNRKRQRLPPYKSWDNCLQISLSDITRRPDVITYMCSANADTVILEAPG